LVALVVTGAEQAATESAETAADAAQPAQEESGAEDRYAELVMEDGAFQETWLLPGVNFGQFDKVYFWAGQFQYRDVGPAKRTRSTVMSTRNEEFGISEEDRKKFEEIIRESFAKEFGKAKTFTVINDIDAVDSTTLILRGALLDIISRVPPEYIGRSDIYLSSVGAATFVMELIEARSGNVVALVAERREVDTLNTRGGFATPANSVTIMGDIRRWAGGLARRLRSALDKAIGKNLTS
ncbi:MAG: hypothetical protein AB7I04_23545, partial [Pseudomonadales bacterium]